MRTHFVIILFCFLSTLEHTSLAQKATTFQNSQGKWGYKDQSGQVSIPAKYDYIRVASLKNSQRVILIKNKTYALYATDGRAITGFVYQMISVPNPESQLILAKKSGLYGYINSEGKTVLEFKYNDASNFKNGKAKVWLNHKNFIIDTSGKDTKELSTIYIISDDMAKPKIRFKKYFDYLKDSLRYPKEAYKLGVEGRVYVQFYVEKDGSLSSFRISKGIGSGCDKEAIRLIKDGPKWIPARQRGVTVRVRRQIPVVFKIKDN